MICGRCDKKDSVMWIHESEVICSECNIYLPECNIYLPLDEIISEYYHYVDEVENDIEDVVFILEEFVEYPWHELICNDCNKKLDTSFDDRCLQCWHKEFPPKNWEYINNEMVVKDNLWINYQMMNIQEIKGTILIREEYE